MMIYNRLMFLTVIVAWATTSYLSAQEVVLKSAAFGGGCYWCVEAVFQQVEGVSNIRPGFMGGKTESDLRAGAYWKNWTR